MGNLKLKRHYSIIAHSPDVVEIRYGVWNPVSFTLTDDSASGHLHGILSRLDGRSSAAEIAAAEEIPQSDVEKVVEQLRGLNLLEDQSTHALDYYLDHIAPNLSTQEGKSKASPSSIVLFGDLEISEQIARILKSSSLYDQYNVVAADDSLRSLLSECGKSWLFDSLDFEEGVRPFAQWRKQLVVFGVTTVKPLEMRAFNRISLHYRIPWIHAAVDGPFLFVGPTFKPFRSPCYECLETRLVMNMRESASYQRYKSAMVEGRVAGTVAPLDNVLGAMLASLTAFEALNYLLTGASFTFGKMLSIYLPTMEFIFNEVLRSPDCPACSPAPERDDKELYFDVRTLFGGSLNRKEGDHEG
jgi:bacteriocin biosynthesis cyclodehydratase domain-containing protein